MLFIIRFTDKTDCQSIRSAYLSDHIDWLDQRRDDVLVAGSLRHTPESNPVGAFWVVQAESKAAAEMIFQSDPFWLNGLRDHVEILHWSKAFPYEQAVI